jgi:hypothetical protein
MAVTASLALDTPVQQAHGNWFSHRAVLGTLTLSGTYTNPGGDAVPDNLTQDFRGVTDVVFRDSVLSDGHVPKFDPTTKKISLFRQTAATGGLVELAGGVAVSGTVRVIMAGI